VRRDEEAQGHAHGFPLERTSFVGRQREVADVVALVEHARLVTLVGVGGTGKTRLALRAAADAARLFHDGAFFLDLAPLTDPLLVPQCLAAAVGMTPIGQPRSTGRSLDEELARFLAYRHVLLVL